MDRLHGADAGSSTVLIAVRSVTPVRAGKLFASVSVAIDFDGVQARLTAFARVGSYRTRDNDDCALPHRS
jgi:hypothetical protein